MPSAWNSIRPGAEPIWLGEADHPVIALTALTALTAQRSAERGRVVTAGWVWPTAKDQIRASLIDLHRACPIASIWYGSVTGSWWATVPGWQQLLEAHDPAGLARLLGDVTATRRPAVQADRVDGSWAAPRLPREPLVWTETTPRRHATARGGLFGWLLGSLAAGAVGR